MTIFSDRVLVKLTFLTLKTTDNIHNYINGTVPYKSAVCY